ncbi:hypothetical protein NDU88_003491 [Pleurodeles waltl]|uniref:Uncharacterized protein n=1 Tax=Pleurodeles waltl TaxID=8319 RepID=A0AAV7W2I6_PLEWA|nr:hypothetical protein NDU88_003491 [Pleurodeles waltl]
MNRRTGSKFLLAFEVEPWRVSAMKGTMITVERQERITRNVSFFKQYRQTEPAGESSINLHSAAEFAMRRSNRSSVQDDSYSSPPSLLKDPGPPHSQNDCLQTLPNQRDDIRCACTGANIPAQVAEGREANPAPVDKVWKGMIYILDLRSPRR